MSLYHHAKNQKQRTTDALARYVAYIASMEDAKPGTRPAFKVGTWWATHCRDIVRIDSVTWRTVRGTRWRIHHGRRVCDGSFGFTPDGHWIDQHYNSENDLAFQVAKPEWAEELEVGQ
jgi:hypothetical protein